MVKLATARECRTYGPGLTRNRAEYMNAGVYVFSIILLICGFGLLLLRQPKVGLVMVMVGLVLIVVVNVHDLIAHLAGIDYRIGLMELDVQLPVVEVGVPVVQALGAVLLSLGLLFLLIQGVKGHYQNRVETHAMNMIIAGSVLWVIGSILNSCQIYERADGHVQILQQSVQIPFLTGSFLFMVGAILNSREQVKYSSSPHGLHLLRRTWAWTGMFASLLLLIGGLANVIKVFKMLQMDRLRLEKLRGGAQERLSRAREGQTPFLREERRKWPSQLETTIEPPPEPSTPYKDVLVGKS